MLRRTFTLAQANALVPWLTAHFAETRKLADQLKELRTDLLDVEKMRVVEVGGKRIVIDPPKELLASIRKLEEQIRSRIEETTGLGIEVRRVDGLVDFPAWLEGQLVYLCWRFGEQNVSFWHPTTRGYDSRRPIPVHAASKGGADLN
jgi:hypothetical protein